MLTLWLAIIGYGCILAGSLMLIHQGHAMASDKAAASATFWSIRNRFQRRLNTARGLIANSSTWEGFRRLTITNKIRETDDTYSFTLALENGEKLPQFLPGQHLIFRLPVQEKKHPLLRNYSLSETPILRHFYRVTIRRAAPPELNRDAPPGIGSSYFHDAMRVGDRVEAEAPRGSFCLDLDDNRPVVLLAAGIGITPLLSMYKALANDTLERETWMFYGAPREENLAHSEELTALALTYSHLHLHYCLSRQSRIPHQEGIYYHRGRIDISTIKNVLPSNNYRFYLCGPDKMVAQLAIELAEWGVPEADIRQETFGNGIGEILAATEANSVDTNGVPVSCVRSGQDFTWYPGDGTLLTLAEAVGVPIPSSCRSGICGTCRTKIIKGEVRHLRPPQEGKIGEGFCLPCMAVPKSDIELDA